mgnify:CR=1 FL=1
MRYAKLTKRHGQTLAEELPIRIVWRGGAVTDLEVKMRVNSIDNLTRGA